MKLLPLLMLACLTAIPVAAQDTIIGAVLTASTPSVRSVGLKGASAALVGDAGAIFANPASLATISHVALEGSYRGAPFDGFIVSGAIAWRLRQFNIGIGGQLLDRSGRLGTVLDSINGRNPVPEGDRSYEGIGVGSLIYRFGIIAFGGSVKLLREERGGVLSRATAVDLGLTIPIFDIFAFGLSRQNVGGNLRTDSPLRVPGITRMGATMNYVDPLESFRLLSTVEIQWPEGLDTRVIVGLEAGVVVSGIGLRGRVGYGAEEVLVSQSDFTFGGTLELTDLNFDYAYESSGLLGESVHQVGVRLRI